MHFSKGVEMPFLSHGGTDFKSVSGPYTAQHETKKFKFQLTIISSVWSFLNLIFSL